MTRVKQRIVEGNDIKKPIMSAEDTDYTLFRGDTASETKAFLEKGNLFLITQKQAEKIRNI